jgi:hypothetical protein
MKTNPRHKSEAAKRGIKPLSQALRKAVAEASKLPKGDQDALARWLLAELADEKRWRKAFAASQQRLGELADEALSEYRAGRTKPLDPDAL